jgi:hypothetical protein
VAAAAGDEEPKALLAMPEGVTLGTSARGVGGPAGSDAGATLRP